MKRQLLMVQQPGNDLSILLFLLLRSSLLVALVMRTLTALRVFDTISIMTGGGPGSSSEIISYYGYRLAFQSYEMGMAGTVGILTMLLALGLTILYLGKVGIDS